jgi:hypothetical protein
MYKSAKMINCKKRIKNVFGVVDNFNKMQGCTFVRDGTMDRSNSATAIRKGRFLWMDESSRKSYIEALNRKIAEGYFFSDTILTKVVDDLAPIMGEAVDNDL